MCCYRRSLLLCEVRALPSTRIRPSRSNFCVFHAHWDHLQLHHDSSKVKWDSSSETLASGRGLLTLINRCFLILSPDFTIFFWVVCGSTERPIFKYARRIDSLGLVLLAVRGLSLLGKNLPKFVHLRPGVRAASGTRPY